MKFLKTLIFFILPSIIFATNCKAQDWRLAGNNDISEVSKLGSTNSFPVRIVVKNSEKMRIDSQGIISIGTSNPNSSAILQMNSSTKGFLAPRMTQLQRNAIVTPALGLLIYQTNNLPGFYFYNGIGWTALTAPEGTNKSMSNLNTTTAINQNLLPDSTLSISLGSLSNSWKNAYFKGDIYVAGFKFLSSANNLYDKYNTAIGFNALDSNSTFGLENTAIGWAALSINKIGSGNTALGAFTLMSNSTGFSNTALGNHSLRSNTIGNSNTAVGTESLNSNTAGLLNTAVGFNSLSANLDGSENTGIGIQTLAANTSGNGNTALGGWALNKNDLGTYNTSSGYFSMKFNTAGANNTANGAYALYKNTEGMGNTVAGYRAMYLNSSGSDNTAFGKAALQNNSSANYNTAIGDSAMYGNTVGIYNTAIGKKALFKNSKGIENTAIGVEALANNLAGYFNTATGRNSLAKNTNGINNTASGMEALMGNTVGSFNTAIGKSSLLLNTTGSNNTAIGYNAFNSGNFFNSTALGANSSISASNQVRVGDNKVVSIGGIVGWSTLSDRRFKTNIQENVPGMAFINKLKPVTYNLLASSETTEKKLPIYTGFIAQDVEKAANEIGYHFSGVDAPKNDKDFYGLRYAEFVVPLVKSVQELSKKNDDLQKQIDELKEAVIKLINQQKCVPTTNR